MHVETGQANLFTVETVVLSGHYFITIQTLLVPSGHTFLLVVITSSSDLQPSTAIANQLPGQLVYTQITTRGPNCFKFIIALIMPSRNVV